MMYVCGGVSGDIGILTLGRQLHPAFILIGLLQLTRITFALRVNMLPGVNSMTLQSQRTNVAAYMPTDCPTREKHGGCMVCGGWREVKVGLSVRLRVSVRSTGE